MKAGLEGVRSREIADSRAPIRNPPIRNPRKPLLLALEKPDSAHLAPSAGRAQRARQSLPSPASGQ
eukprot:8157612-Alexandrium_andersonii.AAC.1